jgi:YVTN family beta-propeller protein
MSRSIVTCLCLLIMLCISCRHDNGISNLSVSNYPKDVATIILTKCAISGCHNDLSYNGADGLNLTTWDNLFKGAGTGSVVIPFWPDFSSLCFFTNMDTALGIALQPTMPYNSSPLSKGEYETLRNWIAAGAPNVAGQVKFADKPDRKKFYVTNRLCNVVTVVDAASMLQMRYADVGQGMAKYPYCIKVSPDKKNWYVGFYTQAAFVEKFNAEDDSPAGLVNLGTGSWTSFAITADSKHGYFVDNNDPGKIVYADLDNNKALTTYIFNYNFKYPTGIALNEQLKKIYVGTSSGNFIYRIDITDPVNPAIKEMPIDVSGVVNYQSQLDPVELLADVGSSRLYVACAASGEIRVVDMQRDSLIGAITLGSSPAFMGISAAMHQLFVSCPDDEASFPGNRGAVVVIDLQTNTIIKRINTGYQPYGIAVDEAHNRVAVINANVSSGGPASHHVSGCGKKNGNVTFIDLGTLELVPDKKLEVAVFPLGACAR